MLENRMLASRSKEGDYVMTKVLFMELSKDWSCESLSLLQACLEEEDCVNIHVYLQDIILINREDMIQV